MKRKRMERHRRREEHVMKLYGNKWKMKWKIQVTHDNRYGTRNEAQMNNQRHIEHTNK